MHTNMNIPSGAFRGLELLLDLIRDPEKYQKQAETMEAKDRALADREKSLQDHSAEGERLAKKEQGLQGWADRLNEQAEDIEAGAADLKIKSESLDAALSDFDKTKADFGAAEKERLAQHAVTEREHVRRQEALDVEAKKLEAREAKVGAAENKVQKKMADLQKAGVRFE